ncbi:MAG: hypothetical protein IJ015_06220 [Ruminococcus sp.]|nr:hypothetical protein [Ruminococcus sp.]
MKKKRLLLIIAPIITIVLETLPYGVIMHFMSPPPNNSFPEFFSFFSTIPMGYARFGPMLTATISCMILFLLIVYCFVENSKLLTTIKVLLYITEILSLCPLILGFKYLTLVGGLVTLSMMIELIMLHVIRE